MTDDEAIERAIAEEFADRIQTYGGLNAYCRDFNIDKRNFSRYLKEKRTPTLPKLMQHLANMGVPYGEFFDSVNERVLKGE